MNFSKIIKYSYGCFALIRRYHLKRQVYYLNASNVLLPVYAFAFLGQTKTNDSNDNVSKLKKSLNEADNLYENGHYEQCYQFLTSLQDHDVEIQWRICRVLYNMSKESKVDEMYSKRLILEAYHIISVALNENSDHFAVHKWYALLLDTKSAYDGLKERINQLRTVKKHMDIAVTLNPRDATTLHMLGEWCYQIAEMPWHHRKIAETLFASPPTSSYEDALEYYSRAESVHPRFYSVNLLRLGTCYLKLKKEDQAKYYLTLAAAYPAKSNDDHMANKEAAELLKRLKV